MLQDHFRMMGRFNAWANRRVYDAVAGLDDAACRKARPAAFFGSIHGTLNHLLVVDYLWFGRIEGTDPGIASLDQIVHDGLAELRTARAAEDARIVGLIDAMSEDDLAREVSFKLMDGTPATMPVRHMLATVLNHQTHHRGQVHALLKEAGVPPPPLDIVFYLSEAG